MSTLAEKIRACLAIDEAARAVINVVFAHGDRVALVDLDAEEIEAVADALETSGRRAVLVTELRAHLADAVGQIDSLRAELATAKAEIERLKATDAEAPSRDDLETVLKSAAVYADVQASDEVQLREHNGLYTEVSGWDMTPRLTFAEAVTEAARLLREAK